VCHKRANRSYIRACRPRSTSHNACARSLPYHLEDKGEIAEIDAAKPAVLRTVPISPCVEPSGLAMDTKEGVLFPGCDNKMMVVADMKTLKVLATPAIGASPDAAEYDPGTALAFRSNCERT